MDIGAISSTLGVVKDVVNQVNLLKDLTDDIEKATEIQQAKQKALELTNHIISLQNAVMSMQVNYMDLLKENQQLKQEKERKAKYELVEFPTQLPSPLMLYKFIGEGTAHYICPHCYDEQGKTVVLQRETIRTSSSYLGLSFKEIWHCYTCQTEYSIRSFSKSNDRDTETQHEYI